jgi:opacity protein-like surface antigen
MSMLFRALSALLVFASVGCGAFDSASAAPKRQQQPMTPYKSPDDVFREGSQLLAELNMLTCYDKSRFVRAAGSWQIEARPYLAGRPSMVQMAAALKKAADRVLKLPACTRDANDPAGFNGFYLGAAVGAQRVRTNWVTRNLTSINVVDPLDVAASAASPSDTGASGSIYFGYNFSLPVAQAPGGQMILGAEVQIDLGGAKSTIDGIPGIGAFLPGAVGMGDRITIENKSGAALTGHVGVLVTPKMHAYGIFGYAWQRVDATFACNAAVGFCSAGPVEPSFSTKKSLTLSGPILGFGLEYGIGAGWIARTEFRHSFLNDEDIRLGDPATRAVDANLTQDVSTVLIGLRHSFAVPPPPPPPP